MQWHIRQARTAIHHVDASSQPPPRGLGAAMVMHAQTCLLSADRGSVHVSGLEG